MPAFQPGLPAAQVDRALRQALADLDAAQQSALLWFHEVLSRRLYQDLGYASMELYAAQALGFSPNRTSQFLKLARDLDRLPPLKEAVVEGWLEWTKAQQVARVASPRTAATWVDVAQGISRRDLAKRVKAARLAQQQTASGQGALELGAVPAGASEGAPPPEGSAGPEPMAPSLASLPATRVVVTLSFDSLDAARLEAMLEAAKKAGLVPATATREEAILAAMGALLEGGGRSGGHKCDSDAGQGSIDDSVKGGEGASKGADHGDGDGNDAPGDGDVERGVLRRRKNATHYKVVLYRCDVCKQTEVVTGSGRRPVDPAAADAAVENAEISDQARGGSRSRSAIAPGLRRKVLIRDGHRCQVAGCRSTRFLEIHHRVARAAGGANQIDNLVTLCSKCHRFAHRHPQAAEMVCGEGSSGAEFGERRSRTPS